MSLKRTKFMSSMLYLKSYMDKLFDTKANKTDVESLEDKVSKLSIVNNRFCINCRFAIKKKTI